MYRGLAINNIYVPTNNKIKISQFQDFNMSFEFILFGLSFEYYAYLVFFFFYIGNFSTVNSGPLRVTSGFMGTEHPNLY